MVNASPGWKTSPFDQEAHVVHWRRIGVAEMVLRTGDGHREAGDIEHVAVTDHPHPIAQLAEVAGHSGAGVDNQPRIVGDGGEQPVGLEVIEMLM